MGALRQTSIDQTGAVTIAYTGVVTTNAFAICVRTPKHGDVWFPREFILQDINNTLTVPEWLAADRLVIEL